jgi:sulfite dehydrogenase (quinone) subunit SoeC
MHPAYSVILFTTASGAGYGLLCLLGLGAAFGVLPPDRSLGLYGLGLALALITAGLLSSTAHLGHPERAWRAFSQWRTSWLSREGVLAVATYVPAGVLGIGWVLLGRVDGMFAVSGVLTSVLSLLTVLATGMIYQSLPTIRHWHQGLTTPVYLALALATGALLLSLLLALLGLGAAPVPTGAAALLAMAAMLKLAYWRAVDAAPPLATPESATGLGRFGRVRQLEAPHSQANYVMREMGYVVARKHANKLRRLVGVFLFAVPIALCLLAALMGGGPAIAALLTASASAAIGVITERWLFFAEAEHVVVNYYGGSKT